MVRSDDVGNLSYREAGIRDVEAITEFVVKCKRMAYSHRVHFVSKCELEYLVSNIFPQDYFNYRIKSLNKCTTVARIAIDSETERIVGYIEFGLKNQYFDDIGCSSEILCYFVDPDIIGRGVGTNLLVGLLKQSRDQGSFVVGKESIGIMTGRGNPFIDTVYKKIGAYPIKDVDHSVSVE